MTCVLTLRQKGYKLTPQRRLIADIIHDHPAHLTADEIIAHAQERMPGVDKSTVYRTLDLLEEAGCVFKSQMGDTVIYHHADEGHHHHLVCRKCGRTVDCSEDLFAPLERSIARDYGFHVDLHHVVMNGLCEACAKQL